MADFPYVCTACGSGYFSPFELVEHQEKHHRPQVEESALEQVRRRALHGLALESAPAELAIDDVTIPATSSEFARRVHALRLAAARAIAATDTATLDRIALDLERLEELSNTYVAELHEIRREALSIARLCRWVLDSQAVKAS